MHFDHFEIRKTRLATTGLVILHAY